MDQGTRAELLDRLAEAVGSVAVAHPTRVAVDGPPAAGKTTLADEPAALLRTQGRDVIRATIDDFLFPRARRYPRGEYSAEGCYYNAHDCDALNRVLLDPLGPGGDRRFPHAVYDHTADAVLSPPVTTAPADAVLVFDGVFLLRPELIDRWDLRILVSTALEKIVDRAVLRELRASSRSRADVERRWRERYLPAQQLYFATARPTRHADIIVHNDEPQQPAWEAGARDRRHGGSSMSGTTTPSWAEGLDRQDWERLLLNGADGVFLVEAAARLVARHGYWTGVAEFVEFVEFYPPDAAGIWYERAARALDEGRLPVRDQEDGNVLRLAASLVAPYRIILREVVENNSARTIRLMAEALMYAGGFTASEATSEA